MRNYLRSLILSCVGIMFLLGNVIAKEVPEDLTSEFINRPVEKLSQKAKSINKNYMDKQLTSYKQEEKLSFLLALLDNQETCFLPREYFVEMGEVVRLPLRNIVMDVKRPITTRAEGLAVLAKLKDNNKDVISVVEKDPVLKRSITAYEDIYAPSGVIFQMSYLDLKAVDLKNDARINFLISCLKDPIGSVARRKLIEIGSDAVP
ncbi:MAG: hypothetical protein AB1599_07910, partial [Planctomycetota bacterium]